MLRDELLRSKDDEIARCLLSRKRKLSELYFATVGFAGATDGGAPTESRYQQKEQAFLDANDLSKGRAFNEATLPPLPNYAALLPSREAKEADPPAAGLDAKAHSPPSQVDAGVPAPAGTAVDQHEQARQHPVGDQPAPADGVTAHEPNGPAPARAHPAQLSISEQKVNVPVPGTPQSNQGRDSVGPTPTTAVPPSDATQIPPGQKKHGKRPSLALGFPAHPTDQQPLSPVSSAGQYSSNTPIPTATSPDTSPAEEVNAAAKETSHKAKHDTPGQARPTTLVPSTPDEQLRLEEAQSMQQNTLTASKFIGDTAATGDYPSSNEVIQDNVASMPNMPKDQMEGTRPVPPALPAEVKMTDGVVELVNEQPSVDTPTKPTSQVPPTLKKAQTTPAQSGPPAERMTTRVSSGAIRHKSVSEILGETPKSAVSPSEKTHADKSAEFPRTVTPEKSPSESPARMRLKDRKDREKERSRPSTVVFPKQQQLFQQQLDKADTMDLVRQNFGDLARLNDEQDYLFTLFQSKAYAPPRGTHLSTLLASAHKTLSTGSHLVEYQEQMDCRTLRRIYALQNANRWPLRQLKRSIEPPRQGTHWDVLLDHMKWMRTDFREERKWKIAAAKCCADWCAEYVNSDPEHQALLRVSAKIPPRKVEGKCDQKISTVLPPEMGDEMTGVSHSTPDLVPSTEEDSVDEAFNDEPRHDLRDTVAPAAIFSLGSDEFTFSLDMTPAAEKILDELPIYAPIGIAPDTNLPAFQEPPDTVWKTDILPVSKYATGKIQFPEEGPPRKRSRYDYSQYKPESEQPLLDLPPEQTNVALFRPENKPIRDRVHPGHSFRPPTEHPMPSVGFFESRQSSHWTYAEDDELRRLVKEYPYNWSLISSCLSPSSLFTSGAERRTPWECFERWIGLEGLPAEMSKTPYFRAYHQRLETAQRTVLAQQQAAQQQQQQHQQQQQQQPNGNPLSQLPIRRRTTQPLRIDRRRSSKHLALLDAMRKLAKKRETMLQKQQHASQLASLRKVNEGNQPKPPISTPAEFSRLKYDREMRLQERQEQYRQQMIAQQKASLAAQRAGQIPNQQPMMNAPPGRGAPNGLPPNGAPGMPNGAPNGLPNGMAAGVGVNQGRPMQGMPSAPVNGAMAPNPMAMKMMPQSGMQQAAGGRPGMPMQTSPDNARVIREANRLQEQQRILQSRQQQQSQSQQPQFHGQQQFSPQGSNSPNLNMANLNGAPNNPAMMAALQAGGGMQSPPFHNGTPQGVSTPSPRLGQPNPLSSGMVPTISNIQSQIQRANPNMPPEQVNKLATDRLHQYQQQRMSQVAMNAAAGNIGSVQANYQVSPDVNFHQSQANGGTGMQVPQTQGYSPMMRVPQPAQQNRVSVGNSPAMNGTVPPGSRSGTPQTQRSSNGQGPPVSGSNKSPNAPPAPTATS